VEQGKRGVYCGAIGLLSPPISPSISSPSHAEKPEESRRRAVFSVPIRILQKNAARGFVYRVGGAIVWDSSAQDEWRETVIKTRFLSADFRLLETMSIEHGEIVFFHEHLARMKDSAAHLGFVWNEEIAALRPERDGMLRLLLDKTGRFTVEYRDLSPAQSDKVRISPVIIESGDPFLYHKTTYRPYFHLSYDRYYDELFFNDRGELTQGSRTNVVLEINGTWYTPPVSCGLLNGVYRQMLLQTGRCREKVLYKKDLLCAGRIFCVNSVRGIKTVRLE
jgi:para-aminobenzoate synthetase/4-amino-4-deoxychorismate lyase